MKAKINYFIDAGMLFAFLACGVTGILKLPELAIPFDMSAYTKLSVLHDCTGIAGFILAAVHVVLHAQWFTRMTASVFGRKEEARVAGSAARPALKAGRAKILAGILAVLLIAQPQAWAAGHGHGSIATVPQGIDYQGKKLKDGTYTGSATGYMPGLTVEVVVKGGAIASVKVLGNNETPRWFQAVVNVIPQKIVKGQGTDVDTVSGATSSSYGIMSAVENALAKAQH
jgi:uncharacterized protein with FMN-binding domain